jgi:4-aminobutyrate aminotransferase
VLQNVEARSKELFSFLHKMKENPSLHISDVRGQGLMVAVEFGPDKHNGDFSAVKGVAAKVSKRCAERGLLILSTSVFEVIRFIPSLTITKEELADGMKIFQEVVKEVLGA